MLTVLAILAVAMMIPATILVAIAAGTDDMSFGALLGYWLAIVVIGALAFGWALDVI